MWLAGARGVALRATSRRHRESPAGHHVDRGHASQRQATHAVQPGGASGRPSDDAASRALDGGRPSMTLQEAKSIARHLDITLRKVRSGDYRINFRDGTETTAYYTDRLEDAVTAAVEMARKRAPGGEPGITREPPAGSARRARAAAHGAASLASTNKCPAQDRQCFDRSTAARARPAR